MCLPVEIRSKFSIFMFSTDESHQLWLNFKIFIEEFKGDTENFYSNCFVLLVTNLLPTKWTFPVYKYVVD